MSTTNNSIRDFISLPDIFSLINASFGFLAIIMAINGELILSAQFMLLAVIFDSLDGWVARKINRDDKLGFGKNIDSLCDVISFGVAPGIFLYFATLPHDIRYINILVSLLIVLCGILRLSRFNVISDIGTLKDKFVGLPIPATAVVLSSFYLSGLFTQDIGLIIMVIVSLLMISSIEYPKFRGVKTASIILILILALILSAGLSQNLQMTTMNMIGMLVFILSIIYMMFMPLMALLKNLKSGPHVR